MPKKSKRTIKISDNEAIAKLKRYVDVCGVKARATLLGKIYGGHCVPLDTDKDVDGVHIFTPNKSYTGGLDR
jgi:DNA gyrase/topoisomerase IV subunit B